MKRRLRDRLIACFSDNMKINLEQLREVIDRPGISVAYLFGSAARGKTHPLSDVDVAYLGIDNETEDHLYDALYEALQGLLGKENFDLIPLSMGTAPLAVSRGHGGCTLARSRCPSR